MTKTLAAVLALAPLFAAACTPDNPQAPPPSAPLTTSGVIAAQPVSKHDVEAITAERCNREERCANIGVDRKFATREVCVDQIRSDNMNALTNAACPYGIDSSKLQSCLAEIREERCNHPFDTLDRYNACQQRTLCPR